VEAAAGLPRPAPRARGGRLAGPAQAQGPSRYLGTRHQLQLTQEEKEEEGKVEQEEEMGEEEGEEYGQCNAMVFLRFMYNIKHSS
jgi:hypothetical protein